ncbi:MAG: TetR family transcriptional regulator [Aestuariivirga sp.]|uniref:TetR family transcriptional regulator C-terminal domain-containing protein n=1 Tax=Aestuariivirga sp. TaxID=2650926 RepID=UPI00301777F9
MASVRQTETPPPRKATRPVRRQQLIDSTIAVLARKGYAGLTVADVAKEAGLSAGIVIFHFNTKDELLAAVLGALAAEYRAHWEASMNAAGPAAADRLKALLLSDFDTDVYTREKLAAWVAFWGEIQGRPFYDQICAGSDAERQTATEALCREVIAEGGYGLNAALAARGLESLGDGLWVSLGGGGYKGQVSDTKAKQVMATALAAFFPKHYATER